MQELCKMVKCEGPVCSFDCETAMAIEPDERLQRARLSRSHQAHARLDLLGCLLKHVIQTLCRLQLQAQTRASRR